MKGITCQKIVAPLRWRYQIPLLFALFSLLLPLACSSKKLGQGKTDKELFSQGELSLEREDYQDSITFFKGLINRFPSSPYLEKAYFDLARAQYLNEENVNAQVGFDDFIRLYPDSKLVPRALLLKGKVLELDVEKPGRDQSSTLSAMKVYSELVQKYPSTPEGKEGEKRYVILRGHMARNELVIGMYYYKDKKYTSAKIRLERAFRDFSDTDAGPGIASLLGETYLKIGNLKGAGKLLKYLEKRSPGAKGTVKLRENMEGATK